jgi:serine/threonine-protein kinase
MTRVHAISIVLGILAGASWALAATLAPHVEPAIDPEVARALVAADAGAHWTAVEVRAAQLAAQPRLAAAVATDAATVRDLTADELTLRVAPREAVELGQVHGGRAVSLLRAPAAAAPAPLARTGRHLSVTGDGLRFTSIASIVPLQGADAMRGAVAVSTAAPPDAALPRLAARTRGRLVIDGAPADIAGGVPAGRGAVEVVLDELPGAPRLILPAAASAPPLAHGLRALALGALLAGLAVALVVRARSRSPRAAARRPAAAPIPEPARPRVGRYEPMALLGQGGTSSVYLARVTGAGGFERRLALKVLRPHLARDERQRTIFLDEARVVSCIDHPNVIQILDLGAAGDQIFIAMEHVDGDDLESTIAHLRAAGRYVPVEIAVAILQRICAGLHAAHTASDRHGRPLRVVHRDVKPGNVLVSRAGSIKVSDFGLAKARQQAHTSLLGQARGTAAFMAPEQRLGQLVDARTDVFGVSAIGYELITSLEIDLDLARLARHGTAGWPHLPPIRRVRPDVPPALEQLLFRGLAFSQGDRPASCAELEDELARIAAEAGWAIGDRDLAAWVQGELARRPPQQASRP